MIHVRHVHLLHVDVHLVGHCQDLLVGLLVIRDQRPAVVLHLARGGLALRHLARLDLLHVGVVEMAEDHLIGHLPLVAIHVRVAIHGRIAALHRRIAALHRRVAIHVLIGLIRGRLIASGTRLVVVGAGGKWRERERRGKQGHVQFHGLSSSRTLSGPLETLLLTGRRESAGPRPCRRAPARYRGPAVPGVPPSVPDPGPVAEPGGPAVPAVGPAGPAVPGVGIAGPAIAGGPGSPPPPPAVPPSVNPDAPPPGPPPAPAP